MLPVVKVDGKDVPTRVGYRVDEDGTKVRIAKTHERGTLEMTTTDSTVAAPAVPRLKQRYREEIVPALREEFGFANVMQVPGVTKVVVNMGVGDAARDSKLIEGAIRDLGAITGQRPVGHQGTQVDRPVQAA